MSKTDDKTGNDKKKMKKQMLNKKQKDKDLKNQQVLKFPNQRVKNLPHEEEINKDKDLKY